MHFQVYRNCCMYIDDFKTFWMIIRKWSILMVCCFVQAVLPTQKMQETLNKCTDLN
jgi:hypothetical protein